MISDLNPRTLPDLYLPVPARLESVRDLTANEKHFRFRLEDEGVESYLPGQFMELYVPGIGEAPISITSSPSRLSAGVFEMVIRRVGNVTGALHRMEEGAKLGVRGPFGTHFPVDEAMKGKDLLLVCGGIGLVPVHSAIQWVLDNREDYGNITILFGARTPDDRLFVDEIYQWKMREDMTVLETVDVADPTWGGNVGVITTLFPHVNVDPDQTVAVICGPPVMYKFVLLELFKLGMDAEQVYLSLERHMKCGVGKCGHCQINGIYACQEGPVFKYSDITNLKEAL